jgi:hypothetical protein
LDIATILVQLKKKMMMNLEHFVIQEHNERSLGELGWREMLQL